MQLKHLAIAGLASLAAAQNSTSNQTLVQALNSTSSLSSLFALVNSQPNLAAALAGLNNITILAPDNAAIGNFTQMAGNMTTPDMISAILQYHVLNGSRPMFSPNATFIRTLLMNSSYANVTGGQRVEVMNNTAYSGLGANSSIQASAVNFTGGTIHIINRVLSIPPNISTALTAYNLTAARGALNASGALPLVAGQSDLTVFVPNNAAFQAIGGGLANLTMQQLVGILSYHAVGGTVAYSTLLQNNQSIATLAGSNVTITIRNSTVFVNAARVVIPNVLVANGVVHVIDEVLNPNNTATPAANATAGVPAYSGAMSATNVPFTSGQPTPTSSINTGSIAATATGGAGATSSSSGGAWAPKATGALGAVALGGLALIMQL